MRRAGAFLFISAAMLSGLIHQTRGQTSNQTQNPAPDPAHDQNQDQTIRVNTRLVQIMAVVRDKKGAVGDLTKKDFEILDKGKTRQIATFSVAKASEHPAKSSLPPNTFSNKLDQQPDPPVAATVLLFDGLNTAFKDQATARRQFAAFLKSLDPQSPVALYALGNKLRILHDFTGDPARLRRALERYQNSNSTLLANSDAATLAEGVTTTAATAGSTSPLDAAIPVLTEDMLSQIIEPIQTYSIDRRVAITLSAMQVIANRMAGVPGRKNLIWISGAFPLTMAFDRSGLNGIGQRAATYAGPMKEAAAAIDRANVAVYPVDARGLLASDTIRVEMPALRNQTQVGQSSNMPTVEEMTGSREIETMKLLADWTGGKAFYNTNDIRGAVKLAMEDAEVVYNLGFYVDEKELDGSYHEIKVKADRKGAEVRHRKGYFATAVPAANSQSASDILSSAAFAAVDATGIGLTANIVPDPAHSGSFLMALGMDLQTLRLDEHAGKWAGGITVGIIQQATDGKVVDSSMSSVALNVSGDDRKKLMKDGLVMRLAIAPAPGMSQIRAAVLDQMSGNAGSLRIVPPATVNGTKGN